MTDKQKEIMKAFEDAVEKRHNVANTTTSAVIAMMSAIILHGDEPTYAFMVQQTPSNKKPIVKARMRHAPEPERNPQSVFYRHYIQEPITRSSRIPAWAAGISYKYGEHSDKVREEHLISIGLFVVSQILSRDDKIQKNIQDLKRIHPRILITIGKGFCDLRRPLLIISSSELLLSSSTNSKKTREFLKLLRESCYKIKEIIKTAVHSLTQDPRSKARGVSEEIMIVRQQELGILPQMGEHSLKEIFKYYRQLSK